MFTISTKPDDQSPALLFLIRLMSLFAKAGMVLSVCFLLLVISALFLIVLCFLPIFMLVEYFVPTRRNNSKRVLLFFKNSLAGMKNSMTK